MARAALIEVNGNVADRAKGGGRQVEELLERTRLGWLGLVLTPGMGPIRSARVAERLGGAHRIFAASLTELEGAGMPAAAAQFCFDGRSRRAAEDEAQRVAECGGTLVTMADALYPEGLREIYDPPPVLWVRGDARLLARPGIAVVGTRQPSPYGSGMAEMLSRELAQRGLVIFSGMARGVDTAAHKGALTARRAVPAEEQPRVGAEVDGNRAEGMTAPGSAPGLTVAVWGTSIDVVYPKENKRLAEEIVGNGGAIVSEFPLGTFPAPQNFPIRNRVISGLSVGVLVIEAGEHSGTRVTARCAMEQNRDVYAVPGNVTNKNAWGPNTLIKQGAKLTATWEDVWEDLPSQVRLQLEDELGRGNESRGGETASLFSDSVPGPAEQVVLGLLRQDESVQMDELMERLEGRLESSEIFAALFELELSGRVRQMAGKRFLRAM